MLLRRVLLEFGPLSLNTFGLMIALGILAGMLLALREARRRGLDEDKIVGFALQLVLAGIIGARLGYVLFSDPLRFLSHPVEILYLHQGGLTIHGALVGGLIYGIYWTRKNGISFWMLADTLTPSVILGQAIGRVGCDIFGKAMAGRYPWGVALSGRLYHPAQVYEFVLDYLLFLFLWRKRLSVRYEGQLFLYYLVGYNLIRAGVEFFRDNNPPIAGPLTIGHLVSLALAYAGLLAVHFKSKTGRSASGQPAAGLAGDAIAVAGLIGLSLAVFYGFGPS